LQRAVPFLQSISRDAGCIARDGRDDVAAGALLDARVDAMTERAYQILGVDSTASDAQVRAAYRRLAQIYHPDRFGSAPRDIREEAERRMAELNAAFSEVSRTRPAPLDLHEELPSWWRASWDRVWLEDERWQEEIKRRRTENQQRRATHQRWEQIERIYQKRAEAWAVEHPMEDVETRVRETSAPSTQLPEPGPAASSRMRKIYKDDVDNRVQKAKAASQRRATIDLTTEKERAKTPRR